MTDHDDNVQCPQDHTRLLEDLRTLPTPALGRLAEPLLPAAMSGEATPATLEALRLIGQVLSERKAAA